MKSLQEADHDLVVHFPAGRAFKSLCDPEGRHQQSGHRRNLRHASSPGGRDAFHGRKEPVAAACNGLDEDRLARIVTQRRPDLPNAVVESLIELDMSARWPNGCPKDPSKDTGSSDYDVRHYVELSGVWDLPFAREQNARGRLLGGWQLSGILTAHSGFPWSPKTDEQNETEWLQFERPTGVGRNSRRGARYVSIDLAFGKNTRLWGQAGLDVRVNCFNVLNSLNLSPFEFVSDTLVERLQSYGRVKSALAGRVVELQARLKF